MKTSNNEYVFFEKGIALVIANLDFAKELLLDLNYKDTAILEQIIDKYDEVEDLEVWRGLNVELIKFTKNLFSNNEEMLNNRELFVELHEPIFINKYLENLFNSSNEEDINEQEVDQYLKDNFVSTIKKIIDLPNLAKVLDEQMVKILRLIVDDNNQTDVIEGLGIVFAYCTNQAKPLKDEEYTIYSLLTEADALSSFIFFLNEDDED